MHIDGDFQTGKDCKHHCSPSCHPMQTGPDWKYGCLHKAWPQNEYGDFCPIVECGGNPKKCEAPVTPHECAVCGLVFVKPYEQERIPIRCNGCVPTGNNEIKS